MKKLSLSLCFLSLFAGQLYAAKEEPVVHAKESKKLSVQEYYSAATEAYEKKAWKELVKQAQIVVKEFPSSSFAQESTFYLAVAHFHLDDYELANKNFSTYLKKQTTPRHFEESIQYKFSIAEKFQGGAKKHVLGWESLPKWVPAREDALAIYDEVISALPHHDLGAKALYNKAQLLVREEDFKPAVETYQTLIRRFPKHELAAESYRGIGQVYITQCRAEYPDPDFLDLAEINLRKFKQDFPGDGRITSTDTMVSEMKEIYANTLYETGQFFERTKKAQASVIYYKKVISQYPDTKIATLAKERIHLIKEEERKATEAKKSKEPLKAPAPIIVQTAPEAEKEKETAQAETPAAEPVGEKVAETIPRWPIPGDAPEEGVAPADQIAEAPSLPADTEKHEQ